jgi:endoglucanase
MIILNLFSKILLLLFILFNAINGLAQTNAGKNLKLNASAYFETRGLNVFVFNNHYGLFGDEKASGIEIIHHGVRTATNGDVRLNPTPMQWNSLKDILIGGTSNECM